MTPAPVMPEGADPTILDWALLTDPPPGTDLDAPAILTPAQWLAVRTFRAWPHETKIAWLEARGLELAEREHDAWHAWWAAPPAERGPKPVDPMSRPRREYRAALREEAQHARDMALPRDELARGLLACLRRALARKR